MNLNIIFTWWKKQTFGTFLKTLFYGTYVGKDEFNNKYYKSKQNDRWVIYSNNIDLNVFSPMITFLFNVVSLKYFKSSG